MSRARESYRPLLKVVESKKVVDLHESSIKKEGSKIYMSTGAVSHASGSAYLECGRTKIICSIYGPRSTEKSKLGYSEKGAVQCDLKFAPFASEQRRERGQGEDEKVLSQFVKQAIESAVQLERFPKSVIDVFLVVLEDAGGVSSAAITCVCLALADAGIDMIDLVVGSAVSCYDDSELVAHPSPLCRGRTSCADLTLAFMPGRRQMTQISQIGEMPPALVSKAIGMCMEQCEATHQSMREVLTRRVARATHPSS